MVSKTPIANVKPCLCPIDGKVFYARPSYRPDFGDGKTCPLCKTWFPARVVKLMHKAAEPGKLPQCGHVVMVYGIRAFDDIPAWHQAVRIDIDEWRTSVTGFVVFNVQRWTELPVYSIEIEPSTA